MEKNDFLPQTFWRMSLDERLHALFPKFELLQRKLCSCAYVEMIEFAGGCRKVFGAHRGSRSSKVISVAVVRGVSDTEVPNFSFFFDADRQCEICFGNKFEGLLGVVLFTWVSCLENKL